MVVLIGELTLQTGLDDIERMSNKCRCNSGDEASYRLNKRLWEYIVITHGTWSKRVSDAG